MNHTGIRVLELILRETGTYNEQYRRPYNTNLQPGTFNILAERIQSTQKFTPSLMSGIANQFIAPATEFEKAIIVPNGFGERRMRFMMKVEFTNRTGGTGIEIIQGYTDYKGIATTGACDPELEFYINSTIMIRTTPEFTPMGQVMRTTAYDCSHVLSDNTFNDIHTPIKDHRMCPQDVFATMAIESNNDESEKIFDTRTTVTNSASKSKRSNGLATNYMSSILQNYKSASAVVGMGGGELSVLEAARGNSNESLVTTDPFISTMGRIRNMAAVNNFTYRDLLALDPNTDNVRHTSFALPTTPLHQVGLTAAWHGADRDTQVATTLSQSVPSLMMDVMLTRLAFTAWNLDFGGRVQIAITDANGFGDGNLAPALEMFKQRLETEILMEVSFNNQTSFNISMTIDLLGETWIAMSLDGKASVDYVTPSFCDALTVPVLTSNHETATNLSQNFNTLIYALVSDQQKPNGANGGGIYNQY
jgi:hypothetical protein